jgi:hypothetical protein
MSRSLWRSLLALFRSPREPYVPSPEPFLKVDVDALRTQLQPIQRGAAYGAQNLPPSDAASPDSREAEITRFCQDELDRSHVLITKGVDTHLASIRQLSGRSAEAEIRQFRDTALSELQSVAQRCRNRVEVTLQQANDLTEAFRRFQEINRRDSLPDLSRGGLLPIAAFAVMVAIESVMNGNMFAQGNDFGLLGGIFQAIVFSVANVGFGGLVGAFVFRQLSHVVFWRRALGALGVIASGLLGLVLNLGIAHFRDAMAQASADVDAAKVALQQLQSHPFVLNDLVSWLLFSLGFVFFWLACYDGFSMDDPYPSYGRRYRALLAAKDRYERAVAETHHSMASVRDGYTRRIAEIAKQRDVYAHHLTSLYDRIARLTNSYERHCQSIRSVHRHFIEEYRDSNRRARTTQPPGYFALIDDVVAAPIPKYTPPGPLSDISETASEAIGRLTEVHDREISGLVTVAQLGTINHDIRQQLQ